MQDSEFHGLVDELFNRIEDDIDSLDQDVDVDASGDILTIEFADGTTAIISRQIGNHEVWVAAKSGGYHLFLDENQTWQCAATGEDLSGLLSRVMSEQTGTQVAVLN
ncbi:MAG TPA: iron donor protein CyaY [Gammaproteobacteria bacterium]|nr:iron donor protein CyaY [Gammaproteobacteria bacterium]